MVQLCVHLRSPEEVGHCAHGVDAHEEEASEVAVLVAGEEPVPLAETPAATPVVFLGLRHLGIQSADVART